MGRRTISNLSRELKVSRPRIYRAIERLGIETKAGDEYPLEEWEALKKELASVSDANKQKKADAKNLKAVKIKPNKNTPGKSAPLIIGDVPASTLRTRLDLAKQEYDYNRSMITAFQEETTAYIQMHGRTTIMSHNGALSPIPSIANLEKYVKMNITLSKLISDLESDLDLTADGGDDPFA